MFFARLLVKSIAPEVHIKKGRNGSEFEWDTNTIYYDRRPDPFDKCFARHVREKHLFPYVDNYSFRLWSILHELGHYFNDDVEEDEFGKALCAITPKEEALESKEIQDLYYDSPDEIAATAWAIEWIEQHPKAAKFFSQFV